MCAQTVLLGCTLGYGRLAGTGRAQTRTCLARVCQGLGSLVQGLAAHSRPCLAWRRGLPLLTPVLLRGMSVDCWRENSAL